MRESSRLRHAQQTTLIYAVMACLMMLIIVQFLLLMVSVQAFLAGQRDIPVPASLASGLCFIAACWLIRYVLVAPRQDERSRP